MATLGLSFLIQYSSFLQVTITTIKSQISSKFVKIQPRTAELHALERLEKSLDLKLKKCCGHSSAIIFDRILLNLASKEDMHKSLDKLNFSQI